MAKRPWLFASAILTFALVGTSGCPHAPTTTTHKVDPIVITLNGCDTDSPPEKQCFVRLPSGKNINSSTAGSQKIELDEGAILKCWIKNGLFLASFEWNSASVPSQGETQLSCVVGGVEVPFRILTKEANKGDGRTNVVSSL